MCVLERERESSWNLFVDVADDDDDDEEDDYVVFIIIVITIIE